MSKRVWNKRKNYLSKRDYCKVKIISNDGEYLELGKKKYENWFLSNLF